MPIESCHAYAEFWLLLIKEEGLEKPDVGQLCVSWVCLCVRLEVLEVVVFVFGNPQTLILEGGRWGKNGQRGQEKSHVIVSESNLLGASRGL